MCDLNENVKALKVYFRGFFNGIDKNFPTFLGRFSYSYSENSKYNKKNRYKPGVKKRRGE